MSEHGAEYDCVVCSGGDGTMNEVASGLMQLKHCPVCGYIPAGTVNDFASSLKIPKIMTDAAALITKGSIFKCDMGKFNNRSQDLEHLQRSLIKRLKSGKMH